MDWGAPPPTAEDGEQFDPEEWVRMREWTFAKTMPQIPHWYVVRDKVVPEEFDEFVAYINANGYEDTWGSRRSIYLDLGGWKYWAIGNILNREPLYFDPEWIGQPQQRFEYETNIAFVHDITSGPLPLEYGTCDVLYAELPRDESLEAAVAGIVSDTELPVVLVGSPVTLMQMPLPDNERPALISGRPAISYFYRCNTPWPRGRPTTLGLLRGLADSFARVGDFCCGHGLSGRIFLQAGGSFVMSDSDPQMVGYVADYAEWWDKEHWG